MTQRKAKGRRRNATGRQHARGNARQSTRADRTQASTPGSRFKGKRPFSTKDSEKDEDRSSATSKRETPSAKASRTKSSKGTKSQKGQAKGSGKTNRPQRKKAKWRPAVTPETALPLFITCLPGLEPVLLEELEERAIGREHMRLPGGIECVGTLEEMAQANRTLGTAQQVRVRVAEFHATKLPELRRKAESIAFADWVNADLPLRVRVTSRKSRLYHTGAIQERVRAAIDTVLGRDGHAPPPEGDGQQVLVRVDANRVQVSVDTSGLPLHRRGYRLQTAKAPLREDLACALLRTSGWDRRSPFLDPMMGAGTLAIEAALLASGRAPGADRNFLFERLPLHTLLSPVAPPTLGECPPIYGSDRNAGALEAAVGNAERAGVRALLQLDHAPLTAAPGWSEAVGTVVTNPPYGLRIRGDLRPLFGRLGRLIRDRPAWSFACVSPDKQMPKHLGLPATSALLTDHGGIKVRFWTVPPRPRAP